MPFSEDRQCDTCGAWTAFMGRILGQRVGRCAASDRFYRDDGARVSDCTFEDYACGGWQDRVGASKVGPDGIQGARFHQRGLFDSL